MPQLLVIAFATLIISCVTPPNPEAEIRLRSFDNSLAVATCEDGLLCFQDVAKSEEKSDQLKSKLADWQ